MVMYKCKTKNNHVDLIESYSAIFWLHAHIQCKSIHFIMFIKGSLTQKLPIYERHLTKVKSIRVVSSRVKSSRVESS